MLLGRIGAPHGVQGWVWVRSDTRPPENILDYPSWLLGSRGVWKKYRLEDGRPQGKGLVVRLAGIADRDAARALTGADVAVAYEDLPAPDEDEYYWADLQGLQVETLDGQPLGQVDHLVETGAHDVLVVRGERERLIPFAPGHTVAEVDLAAGLIRVDWDPDD